MIMIVTNPDTKEIVEEVELSEEDKLDLDSAADRLRQCGYVVTFKEV